MSLRKPRVDEYGERKRNGHFNLKTVGKKKNWIHGQGSQGLPNQTKRKPGSHRLKVD